MNTIRFTKKHPLYKCFSNFYPIETTYEGMTYDSAEAAFQAAKCINNLERQQFTHMTPLQAKRIGRHVCLRPDWEDIKYQVMLDICTIKFSDPILHDILKNTGNAIIIEDTTAWHDNIWGDCQCPRCKNIPGKNLLGKVLMEVRKNS